MTFVLRRAGWIIPAVLLAGFVLESAAASFQLLGAFRIFFYLLALAGTFLELRAAVRQARAWAAAGRRPSLYLVALFWRGVALGMILVALVFAAANTLLPTLPEVPQWLILGLLGSACVSFFVTGFVLDYAGSRRLLAQETDEGPLRPLFRPRR